MAPRAIMRRWQRWLAIDRTLQQVTVPWSATGIGKVDGFCPLEVFATYSPRQQRIE